MLDIPSPSTEIGRLDRNVGAVLACRQGRGRTLSLHSALRCDAAGHHGGQGGRDRQADQNTSRDGIKRMPDRPVQGVARDAEVNGPGAGIRQRAKDRVDGNAFERASMIESARGFHDRLVQRRTRRTSEVLLLRQVPCDEIAAAIRDRTDPAVRKAGIAQYCAHGVGGHLDRQDVPKRVVTDDGNAEGQQVSARHLPNWTDAADDRLLTVEHLVEAFPVRRRPERVSKGA